MRTFLTTVAMIASVSAPALAQVASADASKVEAGVYNIEPEHSRITFGVSHMGFTCELDHVPRFHSHLDGLKYVRGHRPSGSEGAPLFHLRQLD